MGSLDALASASWQGALLALLAWGFCKLFPRVPARYRATLWWAVSLKMVLAVLVPSALALPLLAPTATVAVAPAATWMPSPSSSGSVGPVPAQNILSIHEFLRLAWLVGASLLLFAHLRQAWKLKGVLRRSRAAESDSIRSLSSSLGLRRTPELRFSDEIDTPFVARAWRPVVLLPGRFASGSTAEEVSMALAHELAHVRSSDLLLAFVPALAQLLLWFHPASWFAAREWTTAREESCDATALLATGGSAATYGELLVRVADSGRRPALSSPTLLGATSAYHTLHKRIENMKHIGIQPSRAVRCAGLALASSALIAALPWAVTAQTPGKAVKQATLSGTWTATKPVYGLKMQYTFKRDGSYLAVIGEMDHQGTYRMDGRRLVLIPDVVAQRKASVYLREQAKNPDGLPVSVLTCMKGLAKPYALNVRDGGKSLVGLGFVAKLDPKAKPLF